MSLGHFEYFGEREYHPRGLATCLRCGHLVRVLAIDGEDLELVDPERRAARRWAELLGMGPPRALSVADRRLGHRAHCHGLDLGATPANRTERTVEVDIDDGLGGAWRTCRVVEDLGEHDQHWRPARHFLRVEPVAGPELLPGPGDLMAYRIAGEDRWILWPYRVRSRTVAADGVLGAGKRAVVEQPAREEVRAPAAAKPVPARLKRIPIAGVPYQGLEYLGHQPIYRGWAWRVKPWGEPDDGRNEMVAIKRPGESRWRIATVEDRIGGRA